MPIDRVPDKRIIQKVNQRLGRTGTAQCKVTVAVRNGCVTVSGQIHYENQRLPILNSARSVEGVRSVVDQLRVKPPAKKWTALPAKPAGVPQADALRGADEKYTLRGQE